MNAVFDPKAPKKACNVSINEDLLREAKALGVNLSQTLEAGLEQRVRELRTKAWLEENRDAVDAYNRYVAEHGVWSDGLRQF